MAKFDEMSKLFDETAAKVTSSAEEWLKFVGTASNLYRYPFGDQLMIYAQRPDAKQCAPMEYWNKSLRCYVNKGAKGIALIDREAKGNKLRYVFDMSDVHKVSDKSIMPYQWAMQEGAKDTIASVLENKYMGSEIMQDGLEFEDKIIKIADRIASDSLSDFMDNISTKLGDSALEEIYDENKGEIMQDALSASIASMLLTRCGMDPKECEDRLTGLQYISMFNTKPTLTELGALTSELVKPVLIEIEKEVARYERLNHIENEIKTDYNKVNETEERGDENGNRVYSERGLSDSKLEGTGSTEWNRESGEIRTSSGGLSEGTQEGNIRGVSADGRTVSTSVDDRPAGLREEGSDRGADEEGRGSEPEDAGRELRSVPTEDSDDRAGSGEDRTGGNDLHLDIEEPKYEQLSFFPTVEEQLQGAKAAEIEVSAAFSMPEIEKAVQEHSTIWLRCPEELKYDDQPVPIKNGFAEEYHNVRIAYDDESHAMLLLADTEQDGGLWLRSFGSPDDAESVANEIAEYITVNQMKITSVEPLQMREHNYVFRTYAGALVSDPVTSQETITATSLSEARKIADEKADGQVYSINAAFEAKTKEQEKIFQKRLIKDENGFYNVQIRQLPLQEYEKPYDGWGTVFIAEVSKNALDSLEKQPGEDVTADDLIESMTSNTVALNDDQLLDVIRTGGGNENSRERIYAKYVAGYDAEKMTDFIKNEIRTAGKGFDFDGKRVSVWFHDNGMSIAAGNTAQVDSAKTYSWAEIEALTRQLVENGSYISKYDAAMMWDSERTRVADQIYFFFRDGMDEMPDSISITSYNYPESEERIKGLLASHEGRELLKNEIQNAADLLNSGEVTLKWRYVKKPEQLLAEIADLDATRVEYALADDVNIKVESFITQDEIDATLTRNGSGVSNGLFRIYDYFKEEHSSKDNVAFLKHEYGIGGRSDAIIGCDRSWEDHDAKGIKLDKGNITNPTTSTLLPWNTVEKRIRKLIEEDKYLSPKAKEAYAAYEQEKMENEIAEQNKNTKELTAEDIQHIEYIGSEYSNLGHTAEHELEADIDGDIISIRYEVNYGDGDDESFSIHTTKNDIYDRMSEPELRKLEEKLNDEVRVGRYAQRIEKAENYEELKDIEFSIMDDESLPNRLTGRVWELYNAAMQNFTEPAQGTFKIYQMKEGEEYRDSHFMNWQYHQKQGIKLNHEDYNLIYEGNLADFSGRNDEDLLEEIFVRFNEDVPRPENYKGYSLSVSDVVTLDHGEGETAHFVDSFGFEDFPAFLQEKEIEVRSELEVPLPNVKVEWSESNIFEDGKTYSVKEFDSIMREADLGRYAKQQEMLAKYGTYEAWRESGEDTEFISYEKTKITINFTDGTSHTERQDIGDGIGGLLEFLGEYQKYDKYMPELRESAGREEDKSQDLAEEKNADAMLSLKVGDHLVDNGGVLWTVTSTDWILRIDKAPENKVDTQVSARSFFNWRQRIEREGTIDDFDHFRPITLEEYLGESKEDEKRDYKLTYTIAEDSEFNIGFYRNDITSAAEAVEIFNSIKDHSLGMPSIGIQYQGNDNDSVNLHFDFYVAGEKAIDYDDVWFMLEDSQASQDAHRMANDVMAIVENQKEKEEQKFIRFGEIPKDERSLNYKKLTDEQKREITIEIEYLDEDETPREAVESLMEYSNWKDVDIEDIFEKGVSVYKQDENGLPIIENLDQAMSLAHRINSKAYSVTGTVVGTGQDNEPLITGVKATEVNITREQLQETISNALKKGSQIMFLQIKKKRRSLKN